MANPPTSPAAARPALPGPASWGRATTDHGGTHAPGARSVLVLAGHRWPHEPETCPVPDTTPGRWHLNGRVLTCPGCGLDLT